MKRVSPAAINALKEALTCIYWYKSDLRSFLLNTIGDSGALTRVNWNEYKRNIASNVVEFLASHQETHQQDLVRLMVEVVSMKDFSHLMKLEDGKQKSDAAKQAVAALTRHAGRYREIEEEQGQAEERRVARHQDLKRTTAVRESLNALRESYLNLLTDKPQSRGYALERLLRELFELFDLDPKASFRLVGEQIDGAFTFKGIDYLLEAKWQNELVSIQDLDSFSGKLSRKLENTLGLFLSVNGFSVDGVTAHSAGRRLMLLMDGSDLMAVLDDRIDLVELLLRKRRAAAQTGNIYVKIHEVL